MYATTRTISSDLLTPIGAFLALARPGASCLLESVEHGGRISRYSFLGLDYVDARSFAAGPAMLDEIRAFVAPHRPDGEAAPLGGALVAFAYDAARPFARLPRRAPDEPAMPDAYVAIPGTWLIFDHYTDRLTIWACADDAEACARRIDACIARLLSTAGMLPRPVGGRGPVARSLDRETFLGLVDRVGERIHEGDVYQLQLGIRFAVDLAGGAFEVYRALRSRNPSPYMFYVDGPFGQVFGASPEFLVRLEGREARIRPLAGTRSRGADEGEDARIAAELLADRKERAEHVMLVDLARNDLGTVCKHGSVRVGELLQIERYSHVMHIVSDVTGTLADGLDGLDLFAAGFPAGTVTGTPKVRAMQLIDELEPVTRGFYAGSIGRWSYGGDFDSCITLRSLHVKDGRAYWQASAGIVADSVPASEYDEILHKTKIVREVLGVSL
ncbi:MAG TPA: chorismate-binding protein [Candidatus Baltobacteraceae bacterium]|jgi:anthranilate synthase component 1